jgi:hypothetical protein
MRQALVLLLKRGIAASEPEAFIGAHNVFLETGTVTFGTQSVRIVLHRSTHEFCVYVISQVIYPGMSLRELLILNNQRRVRKIPCSKAYVPLGC